MADQSAPIAPFPAPPPFWQHFTKQNISRLRHARREAGIPADGPDPHGDDDEPQDIDILSLPTELRYLIPPTPPTNGHFTSFGQDLTLLVNDPTLEAAGIPQLYPNDAGVRRNPQPHLIALARSLLTTFLALTGVLSQNPEAYEEKAFDLQHITFNMHDLINAYRPHQLRETLIMMMEERRDRLQEEITRIDAGKERALGLLRDMQNMGAELDRQTSVKTDVGTVEEPQDAKRRARQRAAWAALEREMG